MSEKRKPGNTTKEKSVRKNERNNSNKRNSSNRRAEKRKEKSSIQQHEDMVLKTAMGFFADELLPYLGIQGEVVGCAPTEVVHLEAKHFLQDFNLVMSDGSWKHFEFQSKNEGIEGLRRYRVYEALTSYQYKVSVTTYVLFSGKIRNPVTELKEGGNTYRIVPIIMKDKNADQLIAELQEKRDAGKALVKADLVPLSLCLLMGGTMSQKDRVKAALDITQKAGGVRTEDMAKIESMVFIMADKFLEEMEMKEIKEEIRMTKLGQMLVEMGREEGREEGIEEGIEKGMEKGIEKGMEKGIEKGMEKGMEKGIKGTVSILKNLEIPPQTILLKIQEQYHLSPEVSKKYL